MILFKRQNMFNAINEYFNKKIKQNGGNLMYVYKFTSKNDDIIEKLKNVDKKYSYNYNEPSSIDLKKMEYETLSDSEIETKAKNSLAEYYNQGVEKINSQNTDKISSIDKKIESEKLDTQNSKDNINKYYDKAKESASNEALKRGLGRSSIILNKLESYDKEKINNLIDLDKQLSTKINTLNTEKDTLISQKENALKSFDIEYALKLSNKISSIKDEIALAEKEAIKYNNDIALKQASYELNAESNRIKNTKSLLEYEKEYGEDALESAKISEKFDIAYDYLMTLSKEDAINFIDTNVDFQKELAGKTVRLKQLMKNRK